MCEPANNWLTIFVMKKYVVLKACGISGPDHQPGDVVELEGHEAVGLLAAHQVAENSEAPKTVDRSVKKSTVKKRSKKK